MKLYRTNRQEQKQHNHQVKVFDCSSANCQLAIKSMTDKQNHDKYLQKIEKKKEKRRKFENKKKKYIELNFN